MSDELPADILQPLPGEEAAAESTGPVGESNENPETVGDSTDTGVDSASEGSEANTGDTSPDTELDTTLDTAVATTAEDAADSGAAQSQ